jgi:glyoxylate/hydroxypyruvate reductase
MPAVLFSSDIDDPALWRRMVEAEFPHLEFREWPDVGDPGEVRYALVFRIRNGVLKTLPDLRAVVALGAGVDQILADPEFPSEVPLIRLLGAGLVEQMSEYGIYAVLHFHRRMGEYLEQQARREWRMLEAVPPAHRSVGVMGLGQLGGDLARKLALIGFDVRGWSRARRTIDGVACFDLAERNEFLARTEILVNLLPLTAETRGILDRELFATLPRGAYVINMGRGTHLVEQDLVAAVEAGQVAGAMLDVFRQEPLPDAHPFWDDPRIIVTPHVAAQPVAEVALSRVAETLRALERGEIPAGKVDPAKGY